MDKQEDYFRRIAEFKERFRKASTETLTKRLSSASMTKEAAIAAREIVEERRAVLEPGEST